MLLAASPFRSPSAQSPQPLQLAGRVVRVRGADSTALRGAWVVAHQVSLSRQGPIDSARSDGAGRFRFRVARPDSSSVYVVSTRHDGIGYFAEPVGWDMGDRAAPIVLAVYDTSRAGPPLALAMRHVVVAAPPAGGGMRRVIDIFQVENPGTTTRVAPDSLHPLWWARLPRGALLPESGEGDVSPTTVRFAGDSILVAAPFPPGAKQIVVTYVLPDDIRELDVPVDAPTRQLDVLVEDSNAVAGGALAERPPVVIERRRFRRFNAEAVAAGSRAGVRFGANRTPVASAWWIAVLVAGLGMAGGLALLTRRSTPPPSADALLGRLVALDERYSGREQETPPAEWAGYLERRAVLKQELARRVARS